MAVTNGQDYFDEELKTGYEKIASKISESPLIGYWRSEKTGREYYDAVCPTQFESDGEALEEAGFFHQKSVFVIFHDREPELLWVRP